MKRTAQSNLQEALYEFPYHYLPELDHGKTPKIHRLLGWGLDYLTYMSFLTDRIAEISPRSLLDIGCGDGRLIYLVKSMVPQTLGVDISDQALAFAEAFNPNVEFRQTSVAELSGDYELVTLTEVLEHIPDENIEGFVRDVARLVQTNGQLLLTVPTVNIPVNRKHHRHYDFQQLAQSLSPQFEIEQHWWLYRRGGLEHLLRASMANRFFILNYAPLLTLIWWIHKRKTYFADHETGSHLVCLAKRRSTGVGDRVTGT